MPPIHQSTLRVIVEHLSRVAAHSTQNKMDAKVRVVTSDVPYHPEAYSARPCLAKTNFRKMAI
jgi:hypothetical protein